MSARSRRLQGSMGSSWGDVHYSSDGDLIHSSSDPNSDLDFDDSDQEMVQEHEDKATPLLSRSSRRSSTQRHETPTNTPNRATARHSQLGSSRNTPRSTNSVPSTPRSIEPSFIMPSVNATPDQYADVSSMHNSQVRRRQMRQSSLRNSPNSSPRVSTRRSSKAFQSPSEPERQEELGPWHYVNLFYEHLAIPLLVYFRDVFSYAMRHFVKPILSVLLGVGIILFGLQMASTVLYSRLANALSPVCLLPGSSYFISFCARPAQENQANFEELVNVQGHFEDILDASKDTSTLPNTIKDSEVAIRDLRTLVKHSRLPSRSQLDLEFHNFVETAKEASNDLTRYNTRIGVAMDRVIATNTWTMAVLQGIGEEQASIGAVTRVFNAVTGAFLSPPPTLQQRIFEQYVLHVGRNKAEITGLIETAQALLMVLGNLDERLDTIFSITTNDDHTISKTQEELLSSLWTKLGGNSASVKANAKQLNLLKNINAYRRKALKHVSETLMKLQEIQAELENLREGIAAPEVLGWREGLPITYHIDLIEKGVNRLRLARGESMRVEGETYRNRIRGVETGEEDGVREIGTGKSTPVVTVKAN